MRRQRVLHRMRNLGDTGQSDDARRTLERVRLAQQTRHRFRAGVASFEPEDIAAEIGNDLTRFDLEILVEIFVGHKSLSDQAVIRGGRRSGLFRRLSRRLSSRSAATTATSRSRPRRSHAAALRDLPG